MILYFIPQTHSSFTLKHSVFVKYSKMLQKQWGRQSSTLPVFVTEHCCLHSSWVRALKGDSTSYLCSIQCCGNPVNVLTDFQLGELFRALLILQFALKYSRKFWLMFSGLPKCFWWPVAIKINENWAYKSHW